MPGEEILGEDRGEKGTKARHLKKKTLGRKKSLRLSSSKNRGRGGGYKRRVCEKTQKEKRVGRRKALRRTKRA